MKNILCKIDCKNVIERINLLSEKSYKHWGKMTVAQMICHCSDQIKIANDEIKIIFIGNIVQRTFLKWLVLLGMPTPKGKIKTYKELDQEFGGTKPTNFNNDREILITSIVNFDKNYQDELKVIHPTFGKMSKKQWGRLIYIHLDYHLQQFGV